MIKVLFGGAFDILHMGHILAMKEAKKFGDYLIVSVMSDERIKFKKGKNRPIMPEEERMAIVNELKCVNEVVCVQGIERPNIGLLDIYEPDVVAIEENEDPSALKELEQACRERRIKFVKLKRIVSASGLDTSKIIKKIEGLKVT